MLIFLKFIFKLPVISHSVAFFVSTTKIDLFSIHSTLSIENQQLSAEPSIRVSSSSFEFPNTVKSSKIIFEEKINQNTSLVVLLQILMQFLDACMCNSVGVGLAI